MPLLDLWIRGLDIILVLIVVEAAAGSLYFSRTGRGIPPASWLANACAGGSLLLAARMILGGETGMAPALALLGALAAHVVDCRQRWK